MLRMELPGKRKRGRPKRRIMDVVKEDMAVVEVTEDDAENRSKWRWTISCGKVKPKDEEEFNFMDKVTNLASQPT